MMVLNHHAVNLMIYCDILQVLFDLHQIGWKEMIFDKSWQLTMLLNAAPINVLPFYVLQMSGQVQHSQNYNSDNGYNTQG
jgi:hypothetical protein